MSTDNCINISKKLSACMKLVGDEYILYILGTLAHEEMRFCQLLRAIPQINPSTLTNRLKKLEVQKLITRKEETLDKISVVYSLTSKGQYFIPVLTKLSEFADSHL